jgi:hypothetical protein
LGRHWRDEAWWVVGLVVLRPAELAGVTSEDRETKDDLVRVSFEPTGDETRQDLGRLGSRRHQLIQQDGTPPRLAPKRFVREHDTQTKTKKNSPQTVLGPVKLTVEII